MSVDDIKLEYDGGASESFRAERLSLCLGYAVAISDIEQNDNMMANVVKLHDHEGLLTVTWINEPTDDDRRCFESAWDSKVCGECHSYVTHKHIASC